MDFQTVCCKEYYGHYYVVAFIFYSAANPKPWKKKQKWKKEIWHRKRAGQTFWRTIWPQKHLWSMRSRVSKSVPVSLIFLYPMDYSLTFICFDCWCKMWGFAPNPLSRPEMEHRCQKWTHRANQKWSSSRTRNGRIACTQKWFKTNIPFYHFKTICRKDDCYTRHKIVWLPRECDHFNCIH